MFDNIEKCLGEYKKVHEKWIKDWNYKPTPEERDVFDYLDLYLAKAIMTDFQHCDKGVKIAKIILAMQGLSNEIKVKIE